jgi:hypothetical protein
VLGASLTKTGFVLDDFTKKTIKEGTETERAAALVKVLNSTYKDFNKNLRQTNAGKMQVLANTANDVKVTIGTGILDALTLLSNDNTIDNLASSMQDFATATSEVIVGLGKVAEKLKALNVPGIDGSFLRNVSGIGAALRTIEALRALGRNDTPQQDRGGQERTAGRVLAAQRRQEIKASKDLLKLKKQEVATLKAKTAIDQLKDKFDIERIGLTKALNEATDEETKLRIRAQLAILDNNEALAKKILEEMKAAEAAKKLAEAADSARAAFDRLAVWNPLSGLRATEADILATIGAALSGLTGRTSMPKSSGGSFMPPALTPYDPLSSLMATTQDLAATGFRYDPLSGMRVTEQDIKITIDTAQTGDRFAQLIAESIQVAGRSGYSTTANGSL